MRKNNIAESYYANINIIVFHNIYKYRKIVDFVFCDGILK